VLKLKFQKLHTTVVRSINAASIIDFLFQEGVIGEEDVYTLQVQGDTRQQCRSLMSLLHLSDNPQAFVHLYRAIKEEPHLQWLINVIDQLADPLPFSQPQPTCSSEPTGNSCVCCAEIIYWFAKWIRCANMLMSRRKCCIKMFSVENSLEQSKFDGALCNRNCSLRYL